MNLKILNFDKDFNFKKLKDILSINSKHKVEFVEDDFKDWESKLASEISKLQKEDDYKLVVISDNSALVFMYTSKHENIVCADISDAHSAYMTLLHNNSNIISLSTQVITLSKMKNIIESYANSHFEAGRHMIRINMLNEIVKKGCQ